MFLRFRFIYMYKYFRENEKLVPEKCWLEDYPFFESLWNGPLLDDMLIFSGDRYI